MYKVVYDELSGRFYPCEVEEDGTVNRIYAGATMKRIYQKLAKKARHVVGLDGYSYYHGGRNLFDAEELKVGAEKKVVITNTTGSGHYP